MVRLAVALTFFLLVAAQDATHSSLRKDAPIVIIGAGAAGLSAAQRLHDSGFTRVTILEAQTRIGGRVYSRAHGSNFLEMGAHNIHGEQNDLYNFARDNDLLDPMFETTKDALYPESKKTGPDGAFLCQTGRTHLFSENQAIKAAIDRFDNITNSLASDTTHRTVSTEAFRSAKFLSSPLLNAPEELQAQAYDFRNRQEMVQASCPDPNLLSTRQYTDHRQYGPNHFLKSQISMQSVLANLTSRFPRSWLQLNRPVTLIRQAPIGSTSRVIVETRQFPNQMTPHPADYVITTVPLAVLKNSPNLFQPKLSAKKQEILARAAYSTASKLYLKFNTPFWEAIEPRGSTSFALLFADSLNKIPYQLYPAVPWHRYAILFEPITQAPNTLRLWVGSQGAALVDRLNDTQVLQESWRLLQQFAGRVTVPRPQALIREKWSTNPYIQGTSYFSLASSQAGFSPIDLAQPDWQVSVDGKLVYSLLFAGEATHPQFFSTVHGAMMSGQREADRIASFMPGAMGERLAGRSSHTARFSVVGTLGLTGVLLN